MRKKLISLSCQQKSLQDIRKASDAQNSLICFLREYKTWKRKNLLFTIFADFLIIKVIFVFPLIYSIPFTNTHYYPSNINTTNPSLYNYSFIDGNRLSETPPSLVCPLLSRMLEHSANRLSLFLEIVSQYRLSTSLLIFPVKISLTRSNRQYYADPNIKLS